MSSRSTAIKATFDRGPRRVVLLISAIALACSFSSLSLAKTYSTLNIATFGAKIQNTAPTDSDDYLAYNSPTPANIYYRVHPVTTKVDFRPRSVKLYIKHGSSTVRIVSLPAKAGDGLTTWNGKNSAGSPVNPGVYTATIEVTASNKKVTSDPHNITVVKVEFQESSNASGFDDTTEPHWLSIPKTDTNTAKALIEPAAVISNIRFETDNANKATVSPSIPTSSLQIITGFGISAGGTSFKAKTEDDSLVCQLLNVAVYNKHTVSVAIHIISENNDDIQIVLVDKGEANATCVDTGADGICNTTKSGDDNQMIPVGQGKPYETAITAGTNQVLDTSPTGDDTIVGQTVTTGSDGICNTTKSGDDVQVIALNNGKPNAPAINTGANGICNTTKSSDDIPLIPVNNGQPNQICISLGTNAKRDTNASGDDMVSGENITTGTDGICNSTAKSTDDPPSENISASGLQSYLNNVYYKQASIQFVVTKDSKSVNYDLNRDGELTGTGYAWSPEEQAIIDAAASTSATLNVYYVKSYSFALGGTALRSSFIQDSHADSTGHITAHELGHSLELGDTYASTERDRLMYGYAQSSNPTELRKFEWDKSNTTASGF